MSGKFFVLEGADGSGKGEQIKLLRKRLSQIFPGEKFIFTREPGGTPFAEDIRRLILSEEAKNAAGDVMVQLFGASRFEHKDRVILPHLKAGIHVISDRFDASTYAFQIMAQSGGSDARELFNLQRKIIQKDIPQWETIILKVSTKVAMERMGRRVGDVPTHFDTRPENFHYVVGLGYEQYAKTFPDGVTTVDADRAIEQVHYDVMDVFRKALTPA